jgi:hypothetical protein
MRYVPHYVSTAFEDLTFPSLNGQLNAWYGPTAHSNAVKSLDRIVQLEWSICESECHVIPSPELPRSGIGMTNKNVSVSVAIQSSTCSGQSNALPEFECVKKSSLVESSSVVGFSEIMHQSSEFTDFGSIHQSKDFSFSAIFDASASVNDRM